jgi:hypothetical protein
MSTQPKPFAFVLMPFSKSFEDMYTLAIKPACEAAGAYAERVDEQIFSGSILERIYNQIAKADLVVADMSDRNPNVFYEVGYAHALGKTTILLTRSAEDIPFDLKHFPHIIYGDHISHLKERLEGTVRWYTQNPTHTEEVTADIFVRVNGVQILENSVVSVEVNPGATGLQLIVELENRLSRVIATVEGRLGLIYPNSFNVIEKIENYLTTDVELDEATRLCLAGQRFELMPGEWWSLTIPLTRSSHPFAITEDIPVTVRLLRPAGLRDYSFAVRVRHK